MTGLYPWIKALHVVAVIAWMAGMLYLPRLFVYHSRSRAGSEQSETFKVMERRLYRVILVPAMAATWVLGVALVLTPGVVSWSSDGWIYGKLALVVAMTGLHGFFGRCVRDFAADANRHSTRFFRVINELPAVLMVIIVVLVIVKPF